MHLSDIINPGCIGLDVEAGSKKRALEEAARLLGACLTSPDAEQIFERLLERERLGSTGLANGVALPHARVPGLATAHGVFLRLAKPVDFDALDGQPVDLVFALLVPEEATEEHLQLLAELAKRFGDSGLCEQLRQSRDPAQVSQLITQENHAAPGHDTAAVRRPA
jgi:PTS system nitrogen regulatory IIA component